LIAVVSLLGGAATGTALRAREASPPPAQRGAR
jgi:hypothetical protein